MGLWLVALLWNAISAPDEFTIPYECQESDGDDARDQIVWRLRVPAAVAGVNYAESFETLGLRQGRVVTPRRRSPWCPGAA